MSLILIGFKGVGKTTYGKKIANLLRWQFMDTDSLIEELYTLLGHNYMNVHEIHKKIGEKAFRQIEEEALNKLRVVEKTIIAIGGGTVLNHKCVEILRKLGSFVYLKRDKEQIKNFIKMDKIPSFLDADDFDKSFDLMYNERLSMYQSLAGYTLDLSQLKDAEILAKLYEIAFKS